MITELWLIFGMNKIYKEKHNIQKSKDYFWFSSNSSCFIPKFDVNQQEQNLAVPKKTRGGWCQKGMISIDTQVKKSNFTLKCVFDDHVFNFCSPPMGVCVGEEGLFFQTVIFI